MTFERGTEHLSGGGDDQQAMHERRYNPELAAEDQRQVVDAITAMRREDGNYVLLKAAALRLRLDGFEDLAEQVELTRYDRGAGLEDKAPRALTTDRIESVARMTDWTVEKLIEQDPTFSPHGSTTFTLSHGRNTVEARVYIGRGTSTSLIGSLMARKSTGLHPAKALSARHRSRLAAFGSCATAT
jgi:molecular chaperone DnaK (HSP70)